MKKTLILAAVISVLAGAWTVAVLNIGKFGDVPFLLWPTFIGWGAFFYAGASVDGLTKGAIQFATGIILAAVATYIYTQAIAAGSDGKFVILGVFVAVLAFPITALSGVAALKGYWAAVPAGFMGAAVFFGVYFYGGTMGAKVDVPQAAIASFLPIFCGLVLGFISLAITNVLAADKPAPAPAARPA
jgi:hypothetical protein